jgi:PPM family protein phosphatase
LVLVLEKTDTFLPIYRQKPFILQAQLNMKVKAAGNSNIGLKRRVNEDSYLINPDTGLYVIADGMGGHKAGEIASRIVVDTMNDYWMKVSRNEPVSFVEPVTKDVPDKAKHLINSISLANIIIHEAQKTPEYRGMGSTVSALLVDNKCIWSANVGDSRVYLWVDGTLRIVSEEHSVEAEQKNLGLLNFHSSSNPYIKNLLTRALGMNKKVDTFITCLEPAPGDIILLCSDGLTNFASEQALQLILGDPDTGLEEKARNLIDAANSGGGGDNTTVILLEVLEDGMWSRFINRLKR